MEGLRHEKELDHWVLWEDREVRVVIQAKTNFPAEYGGHIVVEQKLEVKVPYGNYDLFSKMSIIAAIVQKELEEIGLAPHANIQSNANWAFRNSDGSLRSIKEGQAARGLHIHVYGRRPEDPGWAEPIRPACFQEQKAGKYWGKVFSEEQMRKLSELLQKEIPRALKIKKESLS